jgi:hypothetical protein
MQSNNINQQTRVNKLTDRAKQIIVCDFFENISPHERAIRLKSIVLKHYSYQTIVDNENASSNADKLIIDGAFNDYQNDLDYRELDRFKVDINKFFDLLRNTCNLPVQATINNINAVTIDDANDDNESIPVARVVNSNFGGRKSRKSKKSKKSRKSKKSKKYRK